MKSFFVLASLATCALAQGIDIVTPSESSNLVAGDFPFSLRQNNYIQPIQQGSIKVGALSCSEVDCANESSWGDGAVIYDGPFEPTPTTDGAVQNFTFQFPQSVPKGPAVLHVQHQFQIVSASGPQPAENNATVHINVL